MAQAGYFLATPARTGVTMLMALDFEPDPTSVTIENSAAVVLTTAKAMLGSGLSFTPAGGRWHRPIRAFRNAHFGSPNTGRAWSVHRAGRYGNCGSAPTDKSEALSCRFLASGPATAVASPARSRSSVNGGVIRRRDHYPAALILFAVAVAVNSADDPSAIDQSASEMFAWNGRNYP